MNADHLTEDADRKSTEHARAERSHREHAEDTAAFFGRRMQLDQCLRHRVERQLQKSRGEQQYQRQRINRREREAAECNAPQRSKNQGGARIWSQQTERLECDTAVSAP